MSVNDYNGIGGSGPRKQFIVTTSDGYTFGTNPSSGQAVDGSLGLNASASWFWEAQSCAGKWIAFEFPSPRVITGFTWYQGSAHATGTHQPQGSVDGSSWDNLGSAVAIGGATVEEFTWSNSVAYRHFRLLGVSGNTSSNPWYQEIEFKMERDEYEGGDRTSIITVTTDLTLGGTSGTLSLLVNGAVPTNGSGQPWFSPQSVSGKHLTFTFDEARSIGGFILYSLHTAAADTGMGNFQPQYWDGSAWQNHDSVLLLGGVSVADGVQLVIFSSATPATTAFRFLGSSGTMDNEWRVEFQFFIDTVDLPDISLEASMPIGFDQAETEIEVLVPLFLEASMPIGFDQAETEIEVLAPLFIEALMPIGFDQDAAFNFDKFISSEFLVGFEASASLSSLPSIDLSVGFDIGIEQSSSIGSRKPIVQSIIIVSGR